ncbi:MAG TPA: PEGA domain-containing protein [Vicinamibacterales bacterium]|nr:PEGA domain-containing protein [Vicinamibacterales bacterium]
MPRREAGIVESPLRIYPLFPSGYGYWLPFGYYGGYYYEPYWDGDGFYRRAYPYRSQYGHLRLKVRPRDAQVYVDGYFAGVVDDFDGVFQRLPVRAGSHRVELRAPGYQPLVFDVLVQPGRLVTYRGELERR